MILDKELKILNFMNQPILIVEMPPLDLNPGSSEQVPHRGIRADHHNNSDVVFINDSFKKILGEPAINQKRKRTSRMK